MSLGALSHGLLKPARLFFPSSTGKMITAGAQGGSPASGEEEMEDHEEMEEDSSSNVPMLASRGTFIPGVTPHQWGGAFRGLLILLFEHMKIGNVE